jgi:hypothetical protein
VGDEIAFGDRAPAGATDPVVAHAKVDLRLRVTPRPPLAIGVDIAEPSARDVTVRLVMPRPSGGYWPRWVTSRRRCASTSVATSAS